MKKISLFFIVVFIITLALTACSSNEPEDTGPAEPEPTAVSNVLEEAEEEAPAEAPDVKESKGTFDTVAMVEDLDLFILRSEDMPNAYRIVVNGEQHVNNKNVINKVGEVAGKRYIAATDRVDGWSLELERVNKEDLVPYTMFSQIEVFEGSEGAQTAFGQDWFPAYTDEDRTPKWVEGGCDYGDACVMYYYETLDPATELTTLEYHVAFVYNNTLAHVYGRGLDFDMKPDYIVEVAGILFDKIDAAPMAE